MTDWKRWHDPYDDPQSPLSGRLRAVQHQIGFALDRAAPGPVRLLSLCAGEGRDVLPVLAEHPRGADVTGRLVELDPGLCAAARSAAPPAIEAVQGDAGTTALCAGAAPADVLLLCGIFGNIPDADVARTVAATPSLLATGGTVIWTRHTWAPDLTPLVRAWFFEAGVEAISFVTAGRWAVGAGVLRTASMPLEAHARLFAFNR
ncbi:hypothetical protein GCM10009609_09830 [Pseudonocardia aurantiaca]|uniref:Methyltransferase n=1 Tax=Pseudonocardia aurantiaca TaxID=75290 RepID=A0ABW4FC64_9PSEU